MKKVKSIMFFENGNVAVFGMLGEQIPEIQSSWFKMFINDIRKKGYSLDEDIEIIMPSGRNACIIDLGNGDYNWQIS